MNRTARSLAILGAAALAGLITVVAFDGRGVLYDLFGWPGTWGTGGNMVAWVICGAIGGAWLHAKEQARHLQKMAQAARHHQEQLALARQHHQAVMDHLKGTGT